MKRLFILLASVLLSVSLLGVLAAETKKPKAEKPPKAQKAGKPGKRGPVVHVVAFKFKPEASRVRIKEVEAAFAALPGKIPQILSFEWGTNISPEKLDKGFTHGFVLTFKDTTDRDAYLVHPSHQEFGKLVSPALDDVFVLDFLGTQ